MDYWFVEFKGRVQEQKAKEFIKYGSIRKTW